ncbi:MAG: hypothetical protein QOG75_1232, partial [Mycobacterium sp.]|nr:hypothetical protein [Mycobacterium sp.]
MAASKETRVSDTPTLSLVRLGRSPLIGRERELAILSQQFAEARAGHCSVVLLSGPPGVGKSRLLEEFPPAQLASGVTVLRGGTSRAEGMPPYLPLLEAIGEHIAATPIEQLRSEVGSRAPILATLWPELTLRLGAPQRRYTLSADQERFRLFEALAGFLAAIAAGGALVLLLDDLHWVDRATCDVLVYVLTRLRSGNLLVLGAYRDGEAADNPALVSALAELNHLRLLVTLEVAPLGEDESGILVASLLQADVATEVVSQHHERSEGNPFFLEELARAVADEKLLEFWAGRWHLPRNPRPILPTRAAEAIEDRLRRLDPAVLETLRVASVVGQESSPAVLAQITGTDIDTVEERLRRAQQARIVRPDADGGFVFTHDLLRETLYGQLGPAQTWASSPS